MPDSPQETLDKASTTAKELVESSAKVAHKLIEDTAKNAEVQRQFQSHEIEDQRRFEKHDKDIGYMLTNTQINFADVNRKLDNNEVQHKTFMEDLKQAKSDIGELKVDMRGVKTDVSWIRENMEGNKKDDDKEHEDLITRKEFDPVKKISYFIVATLGAVVVTGIGILIWQTIQNRIV